MHELTDGTTEEEFKVAVTKDVLADIIVNFLGQRERLSFRKEAYFVLDLNDLRQFHLLLDAKVSKEVNMRLEFFQVAITYDDDTTRTLTSLASLDSYHETRNIIPTGVTLTWHYVFRFPNAATVETQKINLSFVIIDGFMDGQVELTVEHTNAVWGVEVLSLLSNQVRKKLEFPSSLLTWLRKDYRNDRLFLGFTLVFAIIPTLLAVYIGISQFTEAVFDRWGRAGASYETREIAATIDRYKSERPRPTVIAEATAGSDHLLRQALYSGEISERDLIIAATLLADGKARNDPAILNRLADRGLPSEPLSEYATLRLRELGEQARQLEQQNQQFEEQRQQKIADLEEQLAESKRQDIQRAEQRRERNRSIVSWATAALVLAASLVISFYSWVRYQRQRSFFLLTDESRRELEHFRLRKQRQRIIGFAGILVAILTGVFANFVFSGLF